MPQNKSREIRNRTIRTLACLAASFLFGSLSAYATPKAAENENAPVTTGTDVARPKISTKPAKAQASGKISGKKKAEAKKTPREAKSTRKAVAKK